MKKCKLHLHTGSTTRPDIPLTFSLYTRQQWSILSSLFSMATLDSSVPTFVSKVRGHSSNYQRSQQKGNSGVLYLIHCLPSDSRVPAGETRVEELYGLARMVSYATPNLQGNERAQNMYIRTYVRIYVGTTTFQANTREQSHADAPVPLDWCILIVYTCTVLYTQHGYVRGGTGFSP